MKKDYHIRLWNYHRLEALKQAMKENKANAEIAAMLGLKEKQVQSRRSIINNQQRVATEKVDKPEGINYATIEIKSIKDAATTLGAKNINGSYYLNGKRILVGAMIQQARGI